MTERETRSVSTDDPDLGECILLVHQGGNGDWYIGLKFRVEGPDQWHFRQCRLSTSGGASSKFPGLSKAILDMWTALGGQKEQAVESALCTAEEVKVNREAARKVFSSACECEFLSINTGPMGECVKCGKPLPATAEQWRNAAIAIGAEALKLAFDKKDLKRILYWIRGLAACSAFGECQCGAVMTIASQGMTKERSKLLADAPLWVKEGKGGPLDEHQEIKNCRPRGSVRAVRFTGSNAERVRDVAGVSEADFGTFTGHAFFYMGRCKYEVKIGEYVVNQDGHGVRILKPEQFAKEFEEVL